MHGDQLVALIKDRCRRRNLTEAEFSQAVAGHGTVIADIRRGRTPSAKRLEKICEVLGLDFYVGPPREAESIPPKIAEVLELSADATVEEAIKAIEASQRPETDQLQSQLRIVAEELNRLHRRAVEATGDIARHPFSDLEDDKALAHPGLGQVVELLDMRDLGTDLFALPKFDVRFAAGPGAFADSESIVKDIVFRGDWLRKYGINPKKCSLVEVDGDSMEPTLHDGAMVLLDHQRTRRLADRVFAVRSDDLLLIKRLVHDNHDWLLVSDNEEEYPPVRWPEDAVVIGQVIWTGRTL